MSDEEYEVEDILTTRVRHNKTQYLVRWRGFGADSDTWEPASNLKNCPEILDRFNRSRESIKTPKTPSDVKRRRSRSRSRSRNRNSSNVYVQKLQSTVKPVEVMINGIVQEKHSAVAELVKSSLDLSPKSFKEAAGRYPTIKEIRSFAKERSYQKFTASDQVSDDEVDEPAPTKPSKRKSSNLGKYVLAFAGLICCLGVLWAIVLWVLSLPVMENDIQ